MSRRNSKEGGLAHHFRAQGSVRDQVREIVDGWAGSMEADFPFQVDLARVKGSIVTFNMM